MGPITQNDISHRLKKEFFQMRNMISVCRKCFSDCVHAEEKAWIGWIIWFTRWERKSAFAHVVNSAISAALDRLEKQGKPIGYFAAYALRDASATRYIEQG